MKNNFKDVDFAAISAYNKRTDKKEVIGVFNGERLRQIRTERGWSQERLGEVIGVSRSAISKIEKGTVPDPKLEQVAKMAEALGVSAEWLSGWTDDRIRIVYNYTKQGAETVDLQFVEGLAEASGEVFGLGASCSTIMHLSELGDEATIIVTPAVFMLTVPLPACV